MDLDDPHHVRVDNHLNYAGKSEKGEKYKVKTLDVRNSNLQMKRIIDIT